MSRPDYKFGEPMVTKMMKKAINRYGKETYL